MAELTPRAMIRSMLQGDRLPRPLLLPIVFALGARLENLSPRAFLGNATRIASSQRQIRNVLGLDGVTCYFDPYLEAEAFGCELTWSADEMTRVLRPRGGNATDLREQLRAPGEIAGRGRIPVACDVLRRLKVMLPGEPALMAGVSGPCALADLLVGSARTAESSRPEEVEFAAELTASVCTSFLESDANVIFIREDGASIQNCKQWAELLSPIVNAIRFYEALPVLLFDGFPPEAALTALEAGCEGVICPSAIDLASGRILSASAALPSAYLPETCLLPGQDEDGALGRLLQALARDTNLCLLTSQRDVPKDVDVKSLASLFSGLRSVSRVMA
ncbi:MAG: hypothetical protein LAO56_06645 [Acidobacteriia bacterium]|nr:hypothetical protein [Terriglobia bacterium]